MSLLTGCTSASTSVTTAKDSAAEGSSAENAGEKTIYVIVKVLGNQYWSVLQAGAEQAGKDLGCNVVVVGTALESDIEGQLTLLQNAVSAQADGIVIAPLDSVSLDAPITEAYNSGTPVVLVDTLINWAKNAPEAWTILSDDIKVNDGDISKAVGFCQDFLTTYPDIKGMFGPNNGSTVGFVTGLTEAKRSDITMVGFDFSSEIETMIRSGEYDVASVVQRQYYMGYDGVKTALELANGGSVSEKTVDTGVIVVDGENVDEPEVQEIINPGK